MTESGDRSSMARRRALLRLAREERASYRKLYAQTRPLTNTHDQARGRALTQLRYLYPDRYLELYDQERVWPGTDIPPDVRSKAWLKANGALADLLAPAYRELFGQLRARMNDPCAYDLAITQLRNEHPDLFARLLAEKISECLAQPIAPLTCCDTCRRDSHDNWFARGICPEPCGQMHTRCSGCGAAFGDCYWKTVRSAADLLIAQAPAIMAAFCDAIRSRHPPESCPACDGGRRCRDHARDRELAEQYQTVAEAIQRNLAALAAPTCTVPPVRHTRSGPQPLATSGRNQ